MLESRLCLLEALDVLDVLEMMRCVLHCLLEALEGTLCLLEVLGMLEVLEAMRCMLLCMLDTVECGLSFGVSKFPPWQFCCYSPPPLDFPLMAHRAFNKLGRLAARQLWHGAGGLDGGRNE